jgi:hypothetical protein
MFKPMFKLGRNRPIARGPRFALKNYLKQSLPTPPERINYVPAAWLELEQMYGNDALGDCVIACMGHIEGVLTGNAGAPLTLSEAAIVDLYSAIGGYVPGNPATDNGCDEQTALNYWQQRGLNGTGAGAIAGWLAVDGSNLAEVKTALWLFENLMFGMELPDAWITPFPSESNFTWDLAGPANPQNGHCVAGVGYDLTGIRISTWGMLGVITARAIAEYATAKTQGELYTVLSQDAISKATLKAPNGFAFAQLRADMMNMGIVS